MSEQTTSASLALKARKHRSRKVRPCDFCRTRKARCIIEEGDNSCALCRSAQHKCTFQEKPPPRKPSVKPEPPGQQPLAAIPKNATDSLRRSPSLAAPCISPVSTVPDEQILNGPVEHVGRSSQYFEELDNRAHGMPSNFVRLNPSESKHRKEQAAGRLLSPTTTTIADVFAVVEPFAERLLKIYFDVVHAAFPVCLLGHLRQSMGKIAALETVDKSWKDSEDLALAPLFACIFVSAANFLWMDSRLPSSEGLDVDCLRDYARRACIIETRLPRLVTVQALMLQFLLLGFKMPATSAELWTSLGLMLTTAQNLGLHEDPTPWPISEQEKTMRKHLWWFLFLTTTFLTHSLGKTNLIHTDSYNVPLLTEVDCGEDAGGDILLRSAELALLLHEASEALFAPKQISRLATDPHLAPPLVLGLMKKLDDWFATLTSHKENSLAYESPALRLTYHVAKISLHRVSMKSSSLNNQTARQEAIETVAQVVKWSKSLTAYQVSSVWPTQSKFDFALVSSFILAMLFSAHNRGQFEVVLDHLHNWRWSLQQHSRTCPELVTDGLARIESFWSGDVDSLVILWQQKQNLAVYQNASSSGSPSDTNQNLGSKGQDVFPLFAALTFPEGIEATQSNTDTPQASLDIDVDQYFWQTSTGASFGVPFDFWSSDARQLADLQIGLMPQPQ